MNKPETSKQKKPGKDRNDPVREILLDAVLIEKMPMKTRIEQASKPLYLNRYE